MARAADPLATLDAAAQRALVAVDDSAQTQLALLAAPDALARACPAGGTLAAAVKQERQLRADVFAHRQRCRVREAVTDFELKGPVAREALIAALEDGIALLSALFGDSGEVRTLRLQLADTKSGHGGGPRPFFARFLEVQKRDGG